MTQSRPPHLTPEQSLAAARRILTAAIKAAPGCEGEALFHGLMLWLDETKISSDDPDIEHASRAIASLSAKMAALGGCRAAARQRAPGRTDGRRHTMRTTSTRPSDCAATADR